MASRKVECEDERREERRREKGGDEDGEVSKQRNAVFSPSSPHTFIDSQRPNPAWVYALVHAPGAYEMAMAAEWGSCKVARERREVGNERLGPRPSMERLGDHNNSRRLG